VRDEQPGACEHRFLLVGEDLIVDEDAAVDDARFGVDE